MNLNEDAKALAAILPPLTRKLFANEDAVAAQLPLAQLKVCGILHDGPKSMSDLGRDLGVSRSAMTQIADRLERTKLVKRASDGTDRRVRCLKLTGLGEQFMRKRQAMLVDRVSSILEQLPPEARQQTLNTFEALLRACEAVDGISVAAGLASVATEPDGHRLATNGHATNGSKTDHASATISLAAIPAT